MDPALVLRSLHTLQGLRQEWQPHSNLNGHGALVAEFLAHVGEGEHLLQQLVEALGLKDQGYNLASASRYPTQAKEILLYLSRTRSTNWPLTLRAAVEAAYLKGQKDTLKAYSFGVGGQRISYHQEFEHNGGAYFLEALRVGFLRLDALMEREDADIGHGLTPRVEESLFIDLNFRQRRAEYLGWLVRMGVFAPGEIGVAA